MNMTRIVLAAGSVLALASCGSIASSASSHPVTAHSSPAAPSLAAGCGALTSWDSTSTSENAAITRQLAGTRAGADFAKILAALSNGDASAASAAGKALTAECAKTGVIVTLSLTVTDPNGKTCPSLDSAGYCPGDDPVTMTKQTDTIVFKVWGDGYPSIQYGTDSNSNSPQGGYGPLGDGNALPWSASLPYDSGALYWAVTAQLEGYGDISDSVTEVITTWCSDSHRKTESFPLASGHASGGYNIATAEYTGGDTGNAGQAESDAGC